jgi:hypothetical protein
MIYRSMTFTAADATVLTAKTRDISVGWFVYSGAVPVGTKVASITDDTHFELSLPALVNLVEVAETTYAQSGVRQERNDALVDIEQMCRERGEEITLILNDEVNVDRGKYGGIEQRHAGQTLTLYAYPVEYAPSIRRLEKAGLREECNALCYLPSMSFKRLGIEFDNLTIGGAEGIDVRRSWAVVAGEKFEVREKAKVGPFSDYFEYWTLALFKR